MGLYIVFHTKAPINCWVPFTANLSLKTEDIDDIQYIQADGHELEAIQKRFTIKTADDMTHFTIPIANNRISRWFGSIAKTIIGNL